MIIVLVTKKPCRGNEKKSHDKKKQLIQVVIVGISCMLAIYSNSLIALSNSSKTNINKKY